MKPFTQPLNESEITFINHHLDHWYTRISGDEEGMTTNPNNLFDCLVRDCIGLTSIILERRNCDEINQWLGHVQNALRNYEKENKQWQTKEIAQEYKRWHGN